MSDPPLADGTYMAEKVISLQHEISSLQEFVEKLKAKVADLQAHKESDTAEIKTLRDVLEQYEKSSEQNMWELVGVTNALRRQEMMYESLEEVHAKTERDLGDLRERMSASEELRKSAEKDIVTLREQLLSLVTLVRTKTQEAWVFSIALRSAYEYLPSMSEKESFRGLLDRTTNTTRERLIDKLLEASLSKVNVRMPEVDNPGLASPVSPPRERESEPRASEPGTKTPKRPRLTM
ncbi:hypothetical protein BGZ61DRAFT_529687 [Ilyonectria robusta]|uniref:uncharacterized protein n=1 Tax=Ilyonectria robusta TaxID=1079257 RepID=UPI001E8D1F63|nr:uncharacterized protein BGZ61DRAFT_529687 [Ilyonectria robusta]KAH8729490.1 hypothetical protein BGZ61DRAFT_529687 [Ilyonectria robusta]